MHVHEDMAQIVLLGEVYAGKGNALSLLSYDHRPEVHDKTPWAHTYVWIHITSLRQTTCFVSPPKYNLEINLNDILNKHLL